MLVLVEGKDKIPKDGFEELNKLRTRIFFEGCESAASSFLYALVIVKHHFQELRKREY